jgi:carbamoyltransferase
MITLGINYSQMHESSACLVRDGELLFAVAEERLSRLKHDGRFPVHAIRACLDYAKIRLEQVDYVCFGWPKPHRLFCTDLRCLLSGKQPRSFLNVLNSTRYFASMWHQRGGMGRFTYHFGPTKARVRFVDHHLAHAISAYAYSGFPKATVVVLDGRGAWESTSIWYGDDGRLEHVHTVPWPNSLGLFYAEFTYFLGFEKYSDEWKVMGLAPYGQPGVDLREFIRLNRDAYRVNAPRLLGRDANDVSGIESVLGPKRAPESEINSRHRDIAFAVQDECERVMLAVVARAVKQTGCRNLCLAGGVALNSKANGKILASGLVDRIFIQPAATDDGVALGAALAPYLDNEKRLPAAPMRHAYLGPEYSDARVEEVLRTYKLRYTKCEDPASVAADLLEQGKILGWFQGRMEFGPRALGARSILADARDPEMKDKVNNAVKFREAWRPFAPSLLAEAASEYLETATDSPFMVLTSPVRPHKRNVIPAVTHVDGTARPQTVEQDVSPLYWRLISKFAEKTGVPVIMNTSFNLRGEPIVCSPTDAIRTFFSSGLDALLIGLFLVEK